MPPSRPRHADAHGRARRERADAAPSRPLRYEGSASSCGAARQRLDRGALRHRAHPRRCSAAEAEPVLPRGEPAAARRDRDQLVEQRAQALCAAVPPERRSPCRSWRAAGSGGPGPSSTGRPASCRRTTRAGRSTGMGGSGQYSVLRASWRNSAGMRLASSPSARAIASSVSICELSWIRRAPLRSARVRSASVYARRHSVRCSAVIWPASNAWLMRLPHGGPGGRARSRRGHAAGRRRQVRRGARREVGVVAQDGPVGAHLEHGRRLGRRGDDRREKRGCD